MIKPKNFELKFNKKTFLISLKKTKPFLTQDKKRLKKVKKLKLKRIQFLLDIKTYRGVRLKKGLPARGQRTRTNAISCTKKLTVYDNKKKKIFVT